jgi:hypothetical protein
MENRELDREFSGHGMRAGTKNRGELHGKPGAARRAARSTPRLQACAPEVVAWVQMMREAAGSLANASRDGSTARKNVWSREPPGN